MRFRAIAQVVVLFFFTIGWTQSYHEVSGHTAVFGLAEGAKTSPEGKSIKPAPVSGITVAVLKTEIVISLAGQARGNFDVAIHDYSGEKVYQKLGCKGSSYHIKADAFTMSTYTAYVTVDGKTFYRRFELTK